VSFFFEGLDLGWNILLGIALVIFGNILILRMKDESASEKRLSGLGAEA
jgi:drug/metabolite transporter (DMT)-like permease